MYIYIYILEVKERIEREGEETYRDRGRGKVGRGWGEKDDINEKMEGLKREHKRKE